MALPNLQIPKLTFRSGHLLRSFRPPIAGLAHCSEFILIIMIFGLPFEFLILSLISFYLFVLSLRGFKLGQLNVFIFDERVQQTVMRRIQGHILTYA